MNDAALIFPHQLFKQHPALSKGRKIFLVEEPLFFTGAQSRLRFHKKKLLLHRASMQAYKTRLESQGYRVYYVDFRADLFDSLRRENIAEIWFADPVEKVLGETLRRAAKKGGFKAHCLPGPGFLTQEEWLTSFFKGSRHFSMTRFYIAQRKRLQIMVEADKPSGGKWSYDTENRRKIPKSLVIPGLPSTTINRFVREAQQYVEHHFPDNPGSVADFAYPVTHEASEEWLRCFLGKKLINFGLYQDAMVRDESFLFHSVLTPMLNIGLLTPDQIIQETLAHVEKNPVPLNSLEGFLRQVMGWREFMRAIYLLKGEEERKTNFFQHERKLPNAFYNAATGLDPVDTVIRRLLDCAYVHHIERLMVLGNIMLLCEIDPDEVYRWFMELFVDAYDWVMVPNVYGMSQYADGGLITTKPYISSSHYIRRMSDFSAGTWCGIWDGLFWRFVHKHRGIFGKNPRMKMMVNLLDRMKRQEVQKHRAVADAFLNQLWG
jgi:deoxyribodipyrimidine photolyase-related protein